MNKNIKNPKVKLFLDRILTTVKVKKITESGIILTHKQEGQPETRQTVVAAGPNSGVKIGDEVEINFQAFPHKKVKDAPNDVGKHIYEMTYPIETIDNELYFYISSREVKWVYTKSNK